LYFAGSSAQRLGAGMLPWEKERARKRPWKIRSEDILRLLEASGAFPPQLRAYVCANMQQTAVQLPSVHFFALPS